MIQMKTKLKVNSPTTFKERVCQANESTIALERETNAFTKEEKCHYWHMSTIYAIIYC